MNKNDDRVLINHLFSGDYLKQGNIGHEIISIFKCDNNSHYVYAMSSGDYKLSEHFNKIKKIILVRNIDEYKAEVLGICDVEEDIFGNSINDKDNYIMGPSLNELKNGIMDELNPDGTKKDKKSIERINSYRERNKYQIEYIDKNNVAYGGLKPYEIFSGNSTSNYGHEIYLTFKVKNYRKPKKTIYLCDNRLKEKEDENHFVLTGRKRMCGASVQTFESLNEKGIKKLIGAKVWEKKDSSEKVDVNSINLKTKTILDVIKKKSDEIVYSNWLAYYLKNDKNILEKFVNDLLEIKTGTFSNIEIYRETKNNIDIYYEDSENIIVIENKIKSGINGGSKDKNSKEKDEFSQLEKYYNYVEGVKGNKKTYYFLFIPNYSIKDVTKLSEYKHFDKYKIIRYDKIYSFFKNNKSSLSYYDEFVNSLENHSFEYNNELYYELLERFVSSIRMKSKNN